MSQLNVDTIASHTGSMVSLASGHFANFGILQVASFGPIGGSGNQLETTSTTYADVPNHTMTITPKVATSKIFVVMSTGYWAADVDAVYGAAEIPVRAGFLSASGNGSGGCWMFGLSLLGESAGRWFIGHSLNVHESSKSPLTERFGVITLGCGSVPFVLLLVLPLALTTTLHGG